jgi:prepilin-type processing-associated H-X9-DG protein
VSCAATADAPNIAMTTVNPYEPPHADDPQSARGCSWLTWLAVAAVAGLIVVGLLLPMSRRGVPEAARRNACRMNLRAIAQAMLTYEQEHGTLPPACTRDANGRPLHSWRTLLLPYLEERALYDSIDLTKPWDDPTNAAAWKRMPQVYRCPSGTSPDGQTTYMVVVSPEGCFHADGSVGVSAVQQPAKTLLVAEFPTKRAVPWMAPQDADEDMFLASGPDALPDHRGGVANLAMADGSIINLFPTDAMQCDRECRRSLIRTDDRKIDPVE